MNKNNIYSLGGTVQASKGIYIRRQADEKLLELCKQGEFSYILTSRQMGKSSLMINTASELKQADIKSVIIDLPKIGTNLSLEQWYLGLLIEIEEQLNLDTDVEEWWEENQKLGVTQRLTKFFQHVLLEEVASSVVVFVDEIDTTLSLDFTDDFFAAIRYLYVARAQYAQFERLSFVLIGVATPGDLIRNSTRTPFNIGQRLDVTDFTLEEAMPLAEGLGLASQPARELLTGVLEWTGGHPYLTQRLCSIISEQGEDNWSNAALEQVVTSNFLGAMSKQDNNLQFVRDMLTRRAPNQEQVLTVYREISLGSHPVVDEEKSTIKSHLKLSGVVRRQDDALVVRNRIYQQVFDVDWVENKLAQQRPYSQALMAWLKTQKKDESRLLRGQALQDALVWAKDKSLGDADYQFLTASQELDKQEIQFALAETEKRAKQIVFDAEKKAKRTSRIGLGILSAAIVGAIGAGWYAQKLIFNAEKATQLGQKANNALQVFDINQIGELVSAMEAGQGLQNLVGKGRFVEHYPVTSPLKVLKEMLYDIKERNRLKGVGQPIFSPDSKRILTISRDNTTRIWDISGKELAVLKGHTSGVSSARFSADGKRILTASEDKTARIWDISGKELTVLKGHTSGVSSARFSPDGKRILTISKDDTTRIWDSNGKELTVLKGHTSGVSSARFSSDSKRILTASWDNTARIWDSNGKQLAVLKGHTDAVKNARFSSDGKRILTASWDSTARIWDSNGKQLAVLKGHTHLVNSAVFSSDGKRILTASDDYTARIWDSNGGQLAVLKRVNNAVFSPNGKSILTASGNILDVSGKKLAVLKGVNNAVFSPDGKHILTTSDDNTARIWDISSKELVILEGHTSVFSPDGKRILAASNDNTARIWDNTGKQKSTILKGHTDEVLSAVFSLDGKRIITASGDKTARIWDSNGKQLAVLKGHTDAVRNARFSPNGKHILTVSVSSQELKDNTARTWDSNGKQLAILKGSTAGVINAQFSPDGKRILTVPWGNTVRIWDTQGKELAFLKGHTNDVNSAVFSPDGKRILTASLDNTARIWNSAGKELAVLKGHTNYVNSAVFSPNGKHILTASYDNTARIWDSTGKELAVLKGHTSGVINAQFSPDGKRILTTSGDKTARIWDTKGNQLAVLKGHTSGINSAAFSPDGKRILTTSGDKTTRIWRMEELSDLLARGCEWLDDYLVIHAQDLQKLQVCQTPTNTKAAAPYLVELGEELAKAGNVEKAIANFKTALEWNTELKFDSQKKAQEFEKKGKAELLLYEGKVLSEEGDIDNAIIKLQQASRLDPSLDIKPKIKEAQKLAATALAIKADEFIRENKIKEAIAAYKKAQQINAKVEIGALNFYFLCLRGIQGGLAKEVIFACENAVKLAPDAVFIRDGRGFARALTGDYKGAIADFEALIAEANSKKDAKDFLSDLDAKSFVSGGAFNISIRNPDKEEIKQWQKWVKVLREGKNPFTEEELEKLRSGR